MSRTLAKLDLIGGAARIPCPVTKQVRVVGFIVTVVSAANEAFTAQYSVENGVALIEVATADALVATITTVSGALHTSMNQPGAASNTVILHMPLPDMWWEYEITFTITTQNGSLGAGTVLYETESKAR